MPEESALSEAQLQRREQAFRDAEASLWLEGLDPTQDRRYLDVKSKLLAGTITFEEAEAAIRAMYGDVVPANGVLAVHA